MDFVIKRYCEGRWSQVIPLRNAFFVPLTVSFHVRKSYMSHVNFCNLYLKICMEKKKKPVGQRLYWNLTFRISVYCRSNVWSHAGWSIFLCHFSGNECSEQVSENFRNGKIFRQQKFFVGNNFRRH